MYTETHTIFINMMIMVGCFKGDVPRSYSHSTTLYLIHRTDGYALSCEDNSSSQSGHNHRHTSNPDVRYIVSVRR